LFAAERGAVVLATDINPAMVARAGERLKPFPTAVARIEDYRQLAVESNGFDVATSFFGVLADGAWRSGLAEMVRVTRPGGIVVATCWTGHRDCSPAHLLARVFAETFEGALLWPADAIPAFTPDLLASALRQKGLHEPYVETVAHPWSPISSRSVVEECAPMFEGFPAFAALKAHERETLFDALARAFADHADERGVVSLRTSAYVARGTVAAAC